MAIIKLVTRPVPVQRRWMHALVETAKRHPNALPVGRRRPRATNLRGIRHLKAVFAPSV